ncbi:MAG: PKD domain-containing protein, partial [Delftia sp.]|nr:PKD domain-containing protein [Delftia sp.]
SVSHAFARPGIYTVGLRVLNDTNNPDAIDFDQTVVRVNSASRAQAGPDRFAAPGRESIFSASDSFDIDGEITTYQWRFSYGSGAAEGLSTTRSFASPGVYTAGLTVIDNSGASNDLLAGILPAGRRWEKGRLPNPVNPNAHCGAGILPAGRGWEEGRPRNPVNSIGNCG